MTLQVRFAPRKIVSQFIKDGAIGAKRLTSMPDRVSNTITADGRTVRPLGVQT